MRRLPRLGKLLALLLAGCVVASPLQARQLQVKIETVRTAAGSLQQVEASLDWPDGAEQGQLRLRAQQADLPAVAFTARELDWQCPLAFDGERASCAGRVKVAGQPTHRLSLALDAASLDAVLGIGKTSLAVSTRAAAPGRLDIRLARLPVVWLKALAESVWAEGRWNDGQLDGRVQLTQSDDTFAVQSDLRASQVSLETPDGLIAAAGLTAQLHAEYREQRGHTRMALTTDLKGGELLAGDLYVQLPATPTHLAIIAEQGARQPWRISRMEWRDKGVLAVRGQLALDAQSAVSSLDLDVDLADLAQARDRYLSGFLAPAGFSDLVMSGATHARIVMQGGALHALDVDVVEVALIDPRQRFVLSGVAGKLRWHEGSELQVSQLGWQAGALYGIGLGPARFPLESAAGEVRLRSAVNVAALQGHVALDHLRWQPPREGQGTRFQLGASMVGLDMASLSQRLGWPPFTGTLAGRIPAARYERGVLTLDGGLAMQVFDGQMALSDLVMERPFGVAPTLSADVRINGINLEPMTAAFGFGSITGRLDGRIAKLRLVDWSPVAFDARLDTDTQWKGKRRISQRAVEDISSIAGSGLLAGLQAQALRLFDDFGYARIGLGCRLRDNVCRMDGVGSAGDGYTIVEGAGLPRVQVVGFRRSVDWPMLVARLKAVTEGQRPTFD